MAGTKGDGFPVGRPSEPIESMPLWSAIERIMTRRHCSSFAVTAARVAWVSERDKLVRIDGVGDPEEISERIFSTIDAHV